MARRVERRQARTAARLLEAELREIVGRLDPWTSAPIADSQGLQLSASFRLAALRDLLKAPKSELWEEHRATLAAVLPADDWYAMATAYESIDALRGAAAGSESLFLEDGQPIHPVVGDLLTQLAVEAQAGADAVARLAGGSRRPSARPALRDQLVTFWRETSRRTGAGGSD
jgi:hypothetical protein